MNRLEAAELELSLARAEYAAALRWDDEHPPRNPVQVGYHERQRARQRATIAAAEVALEQARRDTTWEPRQRVTGAQALLSLKMRTP